MQVYLISYHLNLFITGDLCWVARHRKSITCHISSDTEFFESKSLAITLSQETNPTLSADCKPLLAFYIESYLHKSCNFFPHSSTLQSAASWRLMRNCLHGESLLIPMYLSLSSVIHSVCNS